MHITTDGIVLREYDVDEQDRMLILLTKEYGVLSAYARGARKFRGTMRVSSELLSYSCFVLFKNKEKYSVDKADLYNIFPGIRRDIVNLSLASYLCQLMNEVAPKGEPAEEYLRLMLNSLHFLSEGKRTPDFIKAVFELRVMTMAGYMPNLIACTECACFEHPTMFFAPLTGRLFCGDCLAKKPQEEKLILLNKTVLAAMRHILYSEFGKLFAFSLPDASLKELNRLTQRFVAVQIDKSFPTLDYYTTMASM